MIYFFLPIDNPRAPAADICTAINPIRLTDNVIELDVVTLISIVSIDLLFVVIIFKFFSFFFD